MKQSTGRLARLLQQDQYTLFVLEGCRFDAFNYETNSSDTIQTEGSAIRGDLTLANSLATHPVVWLTRAFTDWYHDVQVYADNPLFNTDGLTPWNAMPTENRACCEDAYGGVWRAAGHFPEENINESWRRTRTARNSRCTADRVADHVQEEGFGEKNIVWFMDPRPPYVEGGSDVEMAYQNTLRKTLNAISTIIDGAPGKTVITSTHGTSFAPPSVYNLGLDRDHTVFTPGITTPELRDVPWFEAK